VVKHLRSKIWETLIITGIILIVIYRLALVYDYVPEAYWPSTILSNSYKGFKVVLLDEESSPSALGQAAHYVLIQLKEAEDYVKKQQTDYEIAEKTAERCHENMLFRYFNFIGDEANTGCSEQNMKLNEAIKDIDNNSQTKNPNTPNPQQNSGSDTSSPGTSQSGFVTNNPVPTPTQQQAPAN
jgi:hypothetical protein